MVPCSKRAAAACARRLPAWFCLRSAALLRVWEVCVASRRLQHERPHDENPTEARAAAQDAHAKEAGTKHGKGLGVGERGWSAALAA